MTSFKRFRQASASAIVIVLMAATVATITDATTTDPACKKRDHVVTCTWDKPGEYSWQVPKGVTAATVELYGAQGGSTQQATGGLGGYTKVSEIRLEPEWDSLQVHVGGQGKPARFSFSGGYNGGGHASSYNEDDGGAGGGGASDINFSDEWATRLAVAGGGGGAGIHGAGGAGGGEVGGSAEGAGGGSGATENTPGGGGAFESCAAQNGSIWKGGDNNECPDSAGDLLDGGAGGGGWLGGGGGTLNSGGGGGSAYATDEFYPQTTFMAGINAGAGKVVITYTEP